MTDGIPMKYAVVETTRGWIVQREGLELARFHDQIEALTHVADLLRDCGQSDSRYSLAMRYLARA
jgi:hypothetical protein